MKHQPENDPKATIKALQEQFRDLCIVGMRGAEAISSFRESPKEKLATVKECTAQIQAGISGLRTDLEASLVSLSNGEKIFSWEYQALEDIAANAGLSMEEIEGKIKLQNGSVVELDLRHTSITNLTPIDNLTRLKNLYLGNTPVSDLTPLANLSMLEWLYFGNTQVSDLKPLAKLTALKSLGFGGTNVSDLSPLANLTAIEKLYLHHAQVLDLSSLSGLTAIEKLYLHHAQVLDLSSLSGLTVIKSLDLSNTPVSDLSPIAKLLMLGHVWLCSTPALTDPTSLKIIRKLESRGVTVFKESSS